MTSSRTGRKNRGTAEVGTSTNIDHLGGHCLDSSSEYVRHLLPTSCVFSQLRARIGDMFMKKQVNSANAGQCSAGEWVFTLDSVNA